MPYSTGISALGSLTDTFISGGFGLIGQNQAYKQNKALMWDEAVYNNYLAALQWEREMSASNTAYRRAVKDLRAAGLNPILAVSGMSGASTPNVGSGHVSGHSAIGAGSVNSNLGGVLKFASDIKTNTALQNKYDAEAKLALSKIPKEKVLGTLGEKGLGAINAVEEAGKKYGPIIAKKLVDFLFKDTINSAKQPYESNSPFGLNVEQIDKFLPKPLPSARSIIEDATDSLILKEIEALKNYKGEKKTYFYDKNGNFY